MIIRRAALGATLAAVTAVAALTTAGSALAAVGTEPGNLVLNPATGPLTMIATWSTTTACPAGFQGSAGIDEYTLSGTLVSSVSGVVGSPTAPISGALLLGNVGALLATVPGGVSPTAGGTLEWVVDCFSGAGESGNESHAMSTYVSVATGATTYTTSGTAPMTTVTTLTASPSPAPSGGTETLTASVTAADGTSPAGTVQFESGGTNIGTAVAVNTGGLAAPATAMFTAPTTTVSATTVALSAVFTPTGTADQGSTGTFSLVVESSGAQLAGAVPVNVTVPASGSLTVTVATGTLNLAEQGTTGGAFVGLQPGNLVLSTASGALTSTPTWSTTTVCPAGFQAWAELVEFTYPSSQFAVAFLSPSFVINGSSPLSGTLDASVGAELNHAGVSASSPGTALWAVACNSALSGPNAVEYVQSILVSVAAGATTYTTSAPPPPTPPLTATGILNEVTVTDTRNTYPGWSVSGQVSGFTSTGLAVPYTISGDDLGWTPRAVDGGVVAGTLGGGATLGPDVAAGTSPNGLGDSAQVLASAPAGQGNGTNTMSAALTLDIPAAAPASTYTSTLAITYLAAGP